METGEYDSYTALIINWLRGANAGHHGRLYISSRGQGTSLFLGDITLYQTPKRRETSDVRIASLNDNTVTLLVAHDTFGVENIAKRLSKNVVVMPTTNFRADGTIKNGVIKGLKNNDA